MQRLNVDFGKTAADYARYRAGFPNSFFDRMFADKFVRGNDRLLDLGTGTGTLARGFAQRGCMVTGLDPAQSLLDEAKRLDAEAGVKNIGYVAARAEDTGVEMGSFDVVTAGECWHWFDRPKAAAEARRVLRRNGRIILAHFDWVPLPGNVVEATENLIGTHNPLWKLGGRTGLHPYSLADLSVAGFLSIETGSFDVAIPYSHEQWRGRIRASAGVAASLPPDAVAAFDKALDELLKKSFPEDPMGVPHRVWWVTAISP